jgi:hypothetical protein
MSRPSGKPSPSTDSAGGAGDSPSAERAKVAESIGLQTLALARFARAAGLTAIGDILEAAGLEAAAEAAASRWPSDDTG